MSNLFFVVVISLETTTRWLVLLGARCMSGTCHGTHYRRVQASLGSPLMNSSSFPIRYWRFQFPRHPRPPTTCVCSGRVVFHSLLCQCCVHAHLHNTAAHLECRRKARYRKLGTNCNRLIFRWWGIVKCCRLLVILRVLIIPPPRSADFPPVQRDKICCARRP